MLLSIAVALLLITQYSWCIPLDQFYPFGIPEGDLELPNSGFSRFISSPRFSFFGISRSFLYMNPNGIITFSFVNADSFPPRPLPFNGVNIIAPYWFNASLFAEQIDNDNGSSSFFLNDDSENDTSIVYYRHTTDSFLLKRASTEIRRVYPSAAGFSPTSLFIATWDIVEQDFHPDMDNVFQCIIAISGSETFVMFHYADGLFERIDELFDGNTTTVQAGLNAGDGRRFVTIPGSGTEDIVNISNTSNVDIPGVWIFQTNEVSLINPSNDSPVLVEITTANAPTINQPLTLECSATTVSGITSRVDIIWRDGNTQVRRQNNLLARNIGSLVVYNDSLLITSSLSIDDIGSTYECEVVINSIPAITATSSINIPIPSASECRCSSTAPLDLVFVIDESGSIGSSRFQLIREFTANIVADVVGSSPQSRVGVILFNSDAHIQFDLQDHTSLNTLLPAINPGLPYNSGGTDTAEALTLLLSSARNGQLRIRSGVPNVAIVITDGRSNSRFATLSAAATLHASNLFDVYAVGVDGADVTELNAIASESDFVFFSNQFNSIGLRQLQQSIIETLCSAGGPMISFQPSGFFQNTKGQRQDVICSITVPPEVDPDTVELEWLNGDNITTEDGRITIISDNVTSFVSATLSTRLRFDPLFEDDQGNYTCYSIVNDTLKFQTAELTNFRLPNPIVLVTTLDDQVLGDPLTLDCTVMTVIGISSAVDIIWTVDNKIVRRVNDISASISSNSAIYNDSLVLTELTALDNSRTYQCTVLINKDPLANFTGSMMLDFPAPVCFNTTSCDGEQIGNGFVSLNDSISFNQCCFEFSGIAYASNGQCLLCPTTDCSIEVVKDIVFVIDTTSSIGSFRFQMIREFVANLSTNLKLNSPDSRVGVILFDWFIRLQFNLERHTNLSTLLPAINPGLPYFRSSSSSNTAGALEFLLSSAQNGGLGIQNETSNIAIVITDGRSNNQFLTRSAAAALHAANIFDIYAVGFGSADINELRTIASDPGFVYFTNFFSDVTIQELEMRLADQLCSVPSPGISLQPSGFFSSTIGQMQDLICSVTITSAIDPDSVQLAWLDSESIVTSDNRVTVTPTNVTSNAFSFTYTIVLQFAYLMEGDEGNYTCELVADDMTDSQTVRLQNFRIPSPVVVVTTLNIPTLGQSATLQCSAISVRGISSRVDIIWTTGSTTVRRVDGIIPNVTNGSAIYNDVLVTPPLRISDDGRAYQCTVIFNTSPSIVRSRSIVLDFPVPSCYITSGCSGNPLNETISFSDCCTKFSGVSFDLDSRCQTCPTSPNCTFEAVKDVVFVIDTSGSIGFSRFQLVREFTENITATLKANSPESLVGVILYDDFARLHFNILRHTSLSTLLPDINPRLPYNRGFRTDTARALDLLRTSAQNGALGLRNETSNVAIVITEGFSRSSFSTQLAASQLHAMNIFDVYAIGIGGNSFSELRSIASDPSFVFSTSFFSSFSAQRILEDVTEQLCSTPTPRTFLDPDISRGIVGEPIDIVCSVTVTSTVDPNLVDLSWVGITNSNRITVIPTVLTTDNSIGNIYTTIVRFAYLMEGDEGNYICSLTIEDSVQSTFRLDLSIPTPIVNVTTMDDMVFGEPLQLDCTVTAARGLTSNASIRWFSVNDFLGFTRTSFVRIVNVPGDISNDSVVYEDSLFIPSLVVNDSFSDYRCDVFIFSTIQTVFVTGSIELDFPAPSCYLSTRCTGNPIGAVTTSFSECCNVLSGAAFNLGRQCRLCPATDCPFRARDVVFVLDRSFGVRSFEFEFVRDFAESISIALKVGSPNSSVGAILFDRNASIQFDLEEHTSLDTLLPAIDELPYSGLFPTNTDSALRLLLSSAQNDTLGLRDNTTNIAIVFTAGISNSQFLTRIAANNLHAANIFDVYAVGVDRADFFELRNIASDSRFVYSGRRFSFNSFDVQQLQRLVINRLCTIPPPIVQVVAPCEQVVGQSLTLQCNIVAVSDIASTVDIIWTNDGTEVRRVENIQGSLINNFTDYFTIPVLSRSDNNQKYQCEVVINTNPPIIRNNSVVLNVTQPPQMIISPSQSPHIVKVGTQLLLYCAADGLPIPTVQWHGDGVPVHPLQELYQQIYLVPTDSPHTTVYTCIGRNRVKDIEHVAQANVTVVVEVQPCPTIKAPRNGYVTVADDGKFAFFKCGRGFNMRGSYVLQCMNGKWNYYPPICTPVPKVCRWQCDL